jgi:mono/diheme cytochrome c family protein
LELPEGSVLVKTFLLGGTRVETRLFMRHPDGVWAGYSYEWNDAQTDATLLDGSLAKEVAGRTWYFPSRAECLRCHTSAAGRTLGLETAQLNSSLRYPDGGTANQLAVLDAMGMFDGGLGSSPEALPRLAEPGGQGSLEARARSYLHSNCSNCHRPGGPGGGPADLRFSTPFTDMHVCDEPPQHGDLGIAGARLLSPGQPDRSILSARMHALGANRMPPLASHQVDTASVQVVDAWITSLTACP